VLQPAIRRTKIVATLGPAWDSPEQMHALLEAGVNVVRINASHGTPEIRARWITQLKEVVAARQGQASAAILLDLHGPRIRVGRLPAPLVLQAGQEVVFAPEAAAADGDIPTTYGALAQDVHAGSTVLLDDGLLNVEVLSVVGDRVHGRVRYGGELKPNRG
jgi:pyruvate kinase